MGLRPKLALYIVGFVFVTVAAVGFVWLQAEREIYRDDLRNRAISLLQALAVPSAAAIANNDNPTLDYYVSQFSAGTAGIPLGYLAILDHERRVLAHSQPARFGEVFSTPFVVEAAQAGNPVSHETLTGTGEKMLEVAVPVVSGLRWGTLVAGFTLRQVEQDLTLRQVNVALAGLAIALCAGLLAFWILSALVVEPVLTMGRMARRFGRGELTARVPSFQRGDEVAHLATHFNDMAAQIERHTQTLQRVVEERTLELEDSNRELRRVNAQLETLARQDPLTGLSNRRHFMEQLEFEIQRGRRSTREFVLLMIDADHFKNYNDANGHQAGDHLLREMAMLLARNLRATDLFGRYGGEEFIVALLDTSPQEGEETAAKLQQVVAATPLPFGHRQPTGRVTVSVGMSCFPSNGDDIFTLVERADQALYLSKERGRNCVSTWHQIHTKADGNVSSS